MRQQKHNLDHASEAAAWLDTQIEVPGKAERRVRVHDWISLAVVMAMSVVATLVDIGFHEITKSKFVSTLGVAAAFLLTVMAFAFIVRRTKKSSSKAEVLTTRLQTGFLETLDSSYLNPHHLVGDKHVE